MGAGQAPTARKSSTAKTILITLTVLLLSKPFHNCSKKSKLTFLTFQGGGLVFAGSWLWLRRSQLHNKITSWRKQRVGQPATVELDNDEGQTTQVNLLKFSKKAKICQV